MQKALEILQELQILTADPAGDEISKYQRLREYQVDIVTYLEETKFNSIRRLTKGDGDSDVGTSSGKDSMCSLTELSRSGFLEEQIDDSRTYEWVIRNSNSLNSSYAMWGKEKSGVLLHRCF